MLDMEKEFQNKKAVEINTWTKRDPLENNFKMQA